MIDWSRLTKQISHRSFCTFVGSSLTSSSPRTLAIKILLGTWPVSRPKSRLRCWHAAGPTGRKKWRGSYKIIRGHKGNVNRNGQLLSNPSGRLYNTLHLPYSYVSSFFYDPNDSSASDFFSPPQTTSQISFSKSLLYLYNFHLFNNFLNPSPLLSRNRRLGFRIWIWILLILKNLTDG